MPILKSMKSFVVLAANGISDYALRPLTEGGYTALASALERTSSFPDYAGTIITAAAEQCASIQTYCDALNRPSVRVVPVAEHTAAAFFQALIPFAAEADHIFIAWADAPFLDSAGAAQLYAQHCTYKAEYSFADGYPEGLLPQIVAASLVPILAALPFAAEAPLNRSFLFDTVKKDINSYDLETMSAAPTSCFLRRHQGIVALVWAFSRYYCGKLCGMHCRAASGAADIACLLWNGNSRVSSVTLHLPSQPVP